jgi:DNA polymerase I
VIEKYGSCPFARTGWLAIYKTELVRAVERLLSPLGWDRSKIRRELTETGVPELTAFAITEKD